MEIRKFTLGVISVFMFNCALYAQDPVNTTKRDTMKTMERNNKMDKKNDQDQVVDKDKRRKLIRDAEEAKQIMSQTNQNVKNLFETSAGYAIFPNVGKGAYILGGAAGNGIVYEKGEKVGFAQLRQVDIGLQIGGKAYRQVIFFETQEDLEEFKKGDFSFGGDATAVILEKGKTASISFNEGVAVATMPKAGAMIGISIGGQEFDYGELD